jgi:hypothetical protein
MNDYKNITGQDTDAKREEEINIHIGIMGQYNN